MEHMETDKRIYTMAEEKPAKAVVTMGAPLIAGMFIMVLYNLVDTYFIGRLHNDYMLAAVNLAYPVMMVTTALSNMVGNGSASLIARSLGAGDREKADHTVTVGFLLTVINSLVLTALGLLFLPGIIKVLGAQSNTWEFTEQYVRILLIGTIFTMSSYTFSTLLRGEGSTNYSMVGMVAGTIMNLILDPVFIFGLHMEVRGAAIATVLGNACGVAVSLGFYLTGKTILTPQWKYLKPTAEIVKEIFWVGVPATLETLLTSAAYIVLNNLAVAYGELTVAAMGIAQKIMSLGNYIYQGFGAGAQPLMGYNYGAKNFPRMMALLKSGVMVVSGTELVVMAIYGIFAPWLIGIFSDNPEVISTGATVLRALMCILPFVGATSMSRMSFQGMGQPQYAFGITLVRQLILYIPLLLTFDHVFGFRGLIWAQPVTELITMAVSLFLLTRFIRQEAGKMQSQKEVPYGNREP